MLSEAQKPDNGRLADIGRKRSHERPQRGSLQGGAALARGGLVMETARKGACHLLAQDSTSPGICPLVGCSSGKARITIMVEQS